LPGRSGKIPENKAFAEAVPGSGAGSNWLGHSTEV
jgi:hypothetical protein